jgi:hypothetical protein
MKFGGFKDFGELVLKYQIVLQLETFVQPMPIAVDEGFRRRLEFDRLNAPVTISEHAVTDFLIAPVLKEIWRTHSDALMIWSHVQFGNSLHLRGYPDYFFTKRSPLGRVMNRPFVLFVEAKSDDFNAGWAQCLAAMIAAQQLKNSPEQVVLGIVSNGEVWYFANLQKRTFLQDPRSFTLTALDELFAALNFVFNQASQLALASTGGLT